MHSYGNWPDERFSEVQRAAEYIGIWLRIWPLMNVRDMKEKFGTVRVYCGFGWSCFHSIIWPGYMWIHKWWPYKLDLYLSDYIMPVLNKLVVPIQQRAYVWRYKKAVQKWPYLYNEIVSMADHGELFNGEIPGYNHADYWRTIE